MNKSILVIDGDRATRSWLERFFSTQGFDFEAVETGEIGLSKIKTNQPDLIILDLDLPDIKGEDVIKAIFKDSGISKPPVIVFSSRYNIQEISRLFDFGIADFVQKKPGVEDELLGKCKTSLIRSQSATGPLPSGKLISFFSAKGGTGTSTLCLNLAHMITKQVTQKSTLVVDLVLPLGSLAIMTGVREGDSIARLSLQSASQDSRQMKDYLLPASTWNFSILPGSRSLREGQKLDPTRILPIIDSLRYEFDFVLVDLGKTLSRISLPVINKSDILVVVLGPDLVTAELTQTTINYLEEIGIGEERMFLILNRAVGLEGLTKSEIEEKVSHPIQRTVPYARDNFTIATNQNIPFANKFPIDSISMELNNLAGLLIDSLAPGNIGQEI
jgi:MinD-like ATPase involved in chromosome partitioning or flagellar assembly